MDDATARSRLTDLLEDLDGELAVLRGEHAHEDSELSHLDQHPADTASDISEADREDALIEELTRRRESVVDALGRVDRGEYGRCVDCGQPIPDERLEAVPEALRCVADQQRAEAS